MKHLQQEPQTVEGITIYDLVYHFLEKYPIARSSDKFLMWKVWQFQGLIKSGFLTDDALSLAITPETITRARRKVQSLHGELKATPAVLAERKLKANKKGFFIFSERVKGK